jgi:hypothetical protein
MVQLLRECKQKLPRFRTRKTPFRARFSQDPYSILIPRFPLALCSPPVYKEPFPMPSPLETLEEILDLVPWVIDV